MFRNIYKEENGKIIKGTWLPAFFHNVSYYFTEIEVFEDGEVRCSVADSLEELAEKINDGYIVTNVPDGEEIISPGLFSATVNNFKGIDEYEFYKEIIDTIKRLQNKPTSSHHFWEQFRVFLNDPNEDNYKNLKKAFEDIPAHKRIYTLGADGGRQYMAQILLEGRREPGFISEVKEYFEKNR